MKNIQLKIPEHLNGQRIDIALVEADIGLSRRKIRKLIDQGSVYCNKKRLRVASRQVFFRDQIAIIYSEDAFQLQKIPGLEEADLIFLSKDFVVINKPPGLPSQATKDQAVMHVVPLVKKLLQNKKENANGLILVHRLDKETSGLLIVARSSQAATLLTDMFREKTVKKTYEALCHGQSQKKSWEVKNYLSEIDKRTQLVKEVKSGGRLAHTDFELVKLSKTTQYSWIRCFPHTGRSHQLRVHLTSSHLPIIGDKKYGHVTQKNIDVNHQLLHAKNLEFLDPFDKKTVHKFSADYPPEFKRVVEELF